MAQTLTRLLVHVVFSTKDRRPSITSEIESELYRYLGGICRNHESSLLVAGGMPDHVHLLVSLSKNVSLSHLVMDVKKDSSKWMKSKGDEFAGFRWQDGYGEFTVGESQVDDVRAYIARQKEHHATRSFQDEFRALLRKYGLEWDERYVWG